MKRSYEIPVVFRVSNNEEEMQQAIDQVVQWIENSNEFENAGQVTRIDRTMFGRRRLAYEIDGQRDGYYVMFYADVEPAHLAEFELNLRLYDGVLRYLIIRDDEAKPAATAEEDTSDVEATTEAEAETEDTQEEDAEAETE